MDKVTGNGNPGFAKRSFRVSDQYLGQGESARMLRVIKEKASNAKESLKNLFKPKDKKPNEILPDVSKEEESKKNFALLGLAKKALRKGDSYLGNGESGKLLRSVNEKPQIHQRKEPTLTKMPISAAAIPAATITAQSTEPKETPDKDDGGMLGTAIDVGKAAWEGGKGLLNGGKGLLSKINDFGGSKLLKMSGVLTAAESAYEGIGQEAQGKHIDSFSNAVDGIVPEGLNKLNPLAWATNAAMTAGRGVGGLVNKGINAATGGEGIGGKIYDWTHPSEDGIKPNTMAIADNAMDKQVNDNTPPPAAPIVIQAPAAPVSMPAPSATTITMQQRPNEGAYKTFVNNRYVG